MWLIKVVYPGAAFFMSSTTEPKWVKVRMDDGEIRRKLKMTFPEEPQATYNEKPVGNVYEDDLILYVIKERIDKPTRRTSSSRTEDSVLLFIKAIYEWDGDEAISWSQLKAVLGWGEKKTREIGLAAAKKGFSVKKKNPENARKSMFTLTSEAIKLIEKEDTK